MTAGSYYTDEQRREAVAQSVVLGNWRKVGEATGIPQRTLGDWSKQPWFHTLIAEVRAEKGAELDGRLSRIIHTATDQLLDRLENGDPVLVSGEIRRKPVSARDLAMVAAIVYDKRALLREDPTTIVRAPLDLGAITERLRQFAKHPNGIPSTPGEESL